jgi:hypothetical protein
MQLFNLMTALSFITLTTVDLSKYASNCHLDGTLSTILIPVNNNPPQEHCSGNFCFRSRTRQSSTDCLPVGQNCTSDKVCQHESPAIKNACGEHQVSQGNIECNEGFCRPKTFDTGLGLNKGDKCDCLRGCGYVDFRGQLYCIKNKCQHSACGACRKAPIEGRCCQGRVDDSPGGDGLCFCASDGGKCTENQGYCANGGICCRDTFCVRKLADCSSHSGIFK